MARRLSKNQQIRIATKRQNRITVASDDTSVQLLQGRVVAQYGAHIMLEDKNNTLYKAYVRQNLGRIVCGDYVQFVFEQNSPVVINVSERTNLLCRLGFGGKEKPIAANLDQVVIVLAPKPEPSPSLIDRYLIAIKQYKIPVLFVVNKQELIENTADFDFIDEYCVLFNDRKIFTSINAPDSIATLKNMLIGKTSILVGQSGVGKSSLTNKMIPELNLQTNKISEITGLGNHTTSSSTLYHMPEYSGVIIDSPGVRSFNVEHLPEKAVLNGFPELQPYITQCRFSNCRHLQDPGCALTTALAEGKVSARRLESYLQIINTRS